MSRHVYEVEHIASGKTTDHYRVSAGPKGGSQVRVRVGPDGVYACMTCLVVTCAHARAAEEFAHDQRAASAAAA